MLFLTFCTFISSAIAYRLDVSCCSNIKRGIDKKNAPAINDYCLKQFPRSNVISTVTATVTRTTAQTVLSSSAITLTSTSTLASVIVVTETSTGSQVTQTLTNTATVTQTSTPSAVTVLGFPTQCAPVAKRQVQAAPYLVADLPKKQLSSVCACVLIPASTSTRTVTSTAVVGSTITNGVVNSATTLTTLVSVSTQTSVVVTVPTTYITVTVTTTTEIAAATPTLSTFYLKNGNDYGVTTVGGVETFYTVFGSTSPSAVYALDEQCRLYMIINGQRYFGCNYAGEGNSDSGFAIRFFALATIQRLTPDQIGFANCQYASSGSASGSLSCNINGRTTNYRDRSNYWGLANPNAAFVRPTRIDVALA